MLLSSAVVEGDPVAPARAVALRHGSDGGPGITRVRRGKAFGYISSGGKPVRQVSTVSRIRALAIPPAWTNVWISADPVGHMARRCCCARSRRRRASAAASSGSRTCSARSRSGSVTRPRCVANRTSIRACSTTSRPARWRRSSRARSSACVTVTSRSAPRRSASICYARSSRW